MSECVQACARARARFCVQWVGGTCAYSAPGAHWNLLAFVCHNCCLVKHVRVLCAKKWIQTDWLSGSVWVRFLGTVPKVWETPCQLQGSENPEARNSLKKNSKKGPRPQIPWRNCKIRKVTENKYCWSTFSIFSFLFKEFGGWGPGGCNFWVFTRSFRVSGFWIPVAGRAFSPTQGVKVQSFGGLPVGNPTEKARALKACSRGMSFVRVRFGVVLTSEYGCGVCPSMALLLTLQPEKDYIHKCLFWELDFPKKLHFGYKTNTFLELISWKLHYTYSFAIQRITWTNVMGIFLQKSQFQLHEIKFFGINFAMLSGWGVLSWKDQHGKTQAETVLGTPP